MGTNQQFNLRWNNHTNNILQVFLEQFSSEALVDVTLSCQGQFLRAHKMVLSACSPYFQDLFQVHQVQHPVIIMNGMKFNDVKQIVEFMYKGETKVLEAELDDLLAAAETLQVKGLSHVRNKYQKGEIQNADNAASNSEPPPLEPCLPVSAPQAPIAVPVPSLAPFPASGTVSQSQPQPTTKAVSAPTVATSVASVPPLKPTYRMAIPPTKRKKASESKTKQSDCLESAAKKQNCRTGAPEPKPSTAKLTTTPTSVPVPIPSPPAPQLPLQPPQLPVPTRQFNNSMDDDDDLPATIKVEPLDIRDIDEELPWEPPHLVVDMRDENTKTNTAVKSPFSVLRASLLKVRPPTDLAPSSGTNEDHLKENEPKTEPCDGTDFKEWRGGKRVTRIPRPPNAFMIFANEWRRKLAVENPNDSNKEISIRLGAKWKDLTAEKKAVYFSASRIADEEHKKKYPNYYYSPKEARIRKSQQQDLRRRFALERLNASNARGGGASQTHSPDPLRFVKVFMKDSATHGVFVAVDGSNVEKSQEATASNASPDHQGDLEEEFLKLVEEGHVEADVEDEPGDLDGLTEPIDEEIVSDAQETKPVLSSDGQVVTIESSKDESNLSQTCSENVPPNTETSEAKKTKE